MKNIYLLVFALLLAFISGCGGGRGDYEVSGMVQIDGSSTVYPLTEAVAEEFMEEYPGVRVTVGVSGTGGGFAQFVRGNIDINDASRPIRPVEVETASRNNIEYVELPVAYDGIAVMVNSSNDWIECITTEELERIWEPSSDVQRWSDIRPEFPDRPLHLYGPGPASGTFDYFTAAITGEEGASRSGFMASEDDHVLIQGIAGDPNALGFTGMAYYYNNEGDLKLLGVDDGDPSNGEGCILPTMETVQEGIYQPLSRPMFIYVRAESIENEAVRTFVEFYLEHAGELAPQVGYVGLSDRAYELAMERVENRTTGSVFEGEGSAVGVRMEDLLAERSGVPSDTMSAANPSASDTTSPVE